MVYADAHRPRAAKRFKATEDTMKFGFEELEQILDLSDDDKKQGLKDLVEQGKFDALGFPTREECIIAIQLNDVLFDVDPFYQSPCIDYGDAYLAYMPVVEALMYEGGHKDIETCYCRLESAHQEFGLSTRSKIYDAMVAVQQVLDLPSRGLIFMEVD